MVRFVEFVDLKNVECRIFKLKFSSQCYKKEKDTKQNAFKVHK